MTLVGIMLIVAGMAFLAFSTVGVLRLPDLYTRTHAVAKSETVGLLLVFGGLFFAPSMSWEAGVRLALVLGFSLLANPTAVHALVRAAQRSGIEPRLGEHA
jgi:multicomponent Na+:H+ antiporter subunit G